VLLLADHFLAQAAARAGSAPPRLSEALAAHLLAYSWPGNVRELANACAFAVHVGLARRRASITGRRHWRCRDSRRGRRPRDCTPRRGRSRSGGCGRRCGARAETSPRPRARWASRVRGC
jgi:transcriptional regulator with GAF, ATPase, and Fis domain